VFAAKKAAALHEVEKNGYTSNHEYFNRFDGLIHRRDGTKFDPNDGKDVHDFIAKSSAFGSVA